VSTRDLPSVPKESANIAAERLEALRDLFPEAFTEAGVDFDRLRAVLGDIVDEGLERYQFTWSGKRDAIRAFQIPSRATLAPDRENSVNWDDTGHVFIEGENLEVLKLLYRSYFGRVKMIYIDPPYNTGNDFVYPDDYADPLEHYLRITGQKDAEGNLLTSNPETSGRYHSAWLSMMYPRLFIARQLLREDGVIFVSIDDNEVHNLRMLMNEVFGEENFVASVVWQKRTSPANDAKWFSSDHDYLLVYAKDREQWRPNRLPRNERQTGYYKNPDGDPRGPWNSATYTCNKSREQRPNLYYPVTNPNTGEEILPKPTAVWKCSREEHLRHVEEGLLYWGVDGKARMPRLKVFLSDAGDVVPRSVWLSSDVGHTQEAMEEFRRLVPDIRFDTPKPTRLMDRILRLSTDASAPDIVLDFFAGSGAVAQAVLALNREHGGSRRFVAVQLPEPLPEPGGLDSGKRQGTIADIGRERIRRVIARMRQAESGTLDISERETPEDLGFRAYRLQPSNYRFEGGAGESGGEAVLFTQPLVDGWTPGGLLHEIALKQGFDLAVRVERLADITTNAVYRLTDPYKEQACLVCLDEDLDPATPRALGLSREDRFICRDSALDDTLAANLALQCKLEVI